MEESAKEEEEGILLSLHVLDSKTWVLNNILNIAQ